LSNKQRNQEDFLRLFREGLDSTDPDRVFEIGEELRRLNQEYFSTSSEPLEVNVPAS